MFDAIAVVLRRKGFLAITVEDVASEAGVSRRTFYENFTDKTDCFLAAYHDAVQRLIAEVRAATVDIAGTEALARRSLAASLRFFASNVDLAHLAVIEVLGAGPQALAAHDEALRQLVTFAAAEEPVKAAEHAPPPMIVQMLAGEVSQAVYTHVLHDRASELEQLEPLLTYLMLTPMYGPAGAARRSGYDAAGDDAPPAAEAPRTPPAGPPAASVLPVLPSGRHGLPRAFVVDHQRERMVGSMAAMASAKGFGHVTVTDVTTHAGVSRRTFYDQFQDKNDCFLAAFDAIAERMLRAAAVAAKRDDGGWSAAVGRGLAALLELLATEPEFARVALVEALSAGRPALERRDALINRLAAMLALGDPPAADRRLARAIVAGAYETLYQRLAAGEPNLTALAPDLLYCVLVPYLGHDAALHERALALPEQAV